MATHAPLQPVVTPVQVCVVPSYAPFIRSLPPGYSFQTASGALGYRSSHVVARADVPGDALLDGVMISGWKLVDGCEVRGAIETFGLLFDLLGAEWSGWPDQQRALLAIPAIDVGHILHGQLCVLCASHWGALALPSFYTVRASTRAPSADLRRLLLTWHQQQRVVRFAADSDLLIFHGDLAGVLPVPVAALPYAAVNLQDGDCLLLVYASPISQSLRFVLQTLLLA